MHFTNGYYKKIKSDNNLRCNVEFNDDEGTYNDDICMIQLNSPVNLTPAQIGHSDRAANPIFIGLDITRQYEIKHFHQHLYSAQVQHPYKDPTIYCLGLLNIICSNLQFRNQVSDGDSGPLLGGPLLGIENGEQKVIGILSFEFQG